MKIYITKHALSHGIIEAEASEVWGETAVVTDGKESIYYTGAEWHETREAAVNKAEKVRRKKLTYFQNSMRELKSLVF